MIVDADGSVIDGSRFLSAIESGALSHDSMASTDVEVRVHGDTAVVTGITTSKGQFMGEGFTTRERASDVLARRERALAVRLLAAHSIRRIGVVIGVVPVEQRTGPATRTLFA